MGTYLTDFDYNQTVYVKRKKFITEYLDCAQCEGLGCEKCNNEGKIRSTRYDPKYETGKVETITIRHFRLKLTDSNQTRIHYDIRCHDDNELVRMVTKQDIKPYFKKGTHEV